MSMVGFLVPWPQCPVLPAAPIPTFHLCLSFLRPNPSSWDERTARAFLLGRDTSLQDLLPFGARLRVLFFLRDLRGKCPRTVRLL